jgi:adenine-specific DNA methylase
LSIEQDFDVSFVAGMALREKQIQQSYRPLIAVHKWFARRPGTLFRALLLAEFGASDLRGCFFESNDLRGIRVADPFMGGGTPLFEANRLGCDVLGFDINPMAYWVVRQEIEWLDLEAYQAAASALVGELDREVGCLYKTRCGFCKAPAAVKYFLWVKTLTCEACGTEFDLFPGYVLSEDRRHPRNVLVCPRCGDLTEVVNRSEPGACGSCEAPLTVAGPAQRGRCACPACGAANHYPRPERGAPRHRMFAIEYHCARCKPRHTGRFFKKADLDDRGRYDAAVGRLAGLDPQFIPDDPVPPGDETNRLHRWGYRHYREMFNDRQLLGLELAARRIAGQADVRVRNALATNLSDLLRYQNMLCRYDVTVLKSLDIFSVHGFPVSLIECESNMLGIVNGDGGPDHFGGAEAPSGNVGSGGWSNITEKYRRAKAYCARPFEVRHNGRRKVQVPIPGEWIGGARPDDLAARRRKVGLHCASATEAELPPSSLDAVFTDPPYFSNVQYAELMDFCYVWLRGLLGESEPAFRAASTRTPQELTGNESMDRGLDRFAEGISQVFRRMAQALKPGAPLAFTYHHNDVAAYYPIAVAILDSELVCTASLPCPAEMVASLHISGTGSSVVDTVFVCRKQASAPAPGPGQPISEPLADLVRADADRLRDGGVEPTLGDQRCIAFGHAIRLAIQHLRPTWDSAAPIARRLEAVGRWVDETSGVRAWERQTANGKKAR